MTSHAAHLVRAFSALFLLTLLSGCAVLMGPPPVTEPATGMEFVFIKGGSFDMGDATGFWSENELPVHRVTVADFYAGKFEVTFDQYDRFCEATGREKPDDAGWGRGTRPVINVSWDDATAFAGWLSTQSGFSISLPSEAQWEYMARGGTTTIYWTGETLPENSANCYDCRSQWSSDLTAPVGSFPANPYGLHDTAGNVAEWCLDTVHTDYQGAPSDDQPWTGGRDRDRILRGGAWTMGMGDMRSALRDWDNKSSKRNDVGFRLIITPPLPAATQQPK